MTPCHTSPAGINRIIFGLDNVNLLPDVLSSANGMQLSRSKLTRKLIVSGRAAAASQYKHLNNRRVYSRPAGLQLNSAPVKTPRAVEQSAVECTLSAKHTAPCGDSLGVDQKPDVQCNSQPGKFDI